MHFVPSNLQSNHLFDTTLRDTVNVQSSVAKEDKTEVSELASLAQASYPYCCLCLFFFADGFTVVYTAYVT